jgi:hypothetical protein
MKIGLLDFTTAMKPHHNVISVWAGLCHPLNRKIGG